MKKRSLREELCQNPYPGRGIILGKTPDGASAVGAYFIMGRSENSRNRIFVEDGSGIRTQAYDESKVTDPSLIIYAPVRVWGDCTIITNGDQTDTLYEGLNRGLTMEQSLRSRTFEPDGPNYTPRISGILKADENEFHYALSILKSADGNPKSCGRFTFTYENPIPGEGHLIHTYLSDGNPLPSFEGEPKLVGIEGGIDEFANMLWESLDEANKISLFVRFVEIRTGKWETRIFNKHRMEKMR